MERVAWPKAHAGEAFLLGALLHFRRLGIAVSFWTLASSFDSSTGFTAVEGQAVHHVDQQFQYSVTDLPAVAGRADAPRDRCG